MSKPYLFSPSEFAFGYSGCKRCYYDLKVNDVRINFGFPSIFSKIDSIQKKFYQEQLKKVVQVLEILRIHWDLLETIKKNLKFISKRD